MKKSRSRRDWLIGTWEVHDRTSATVLEITKGTGVLKVRAFDKDDGEEYVVTGTKWDGKQLIFEIFVRSNKWRSRHRLKPISKSKVVQELTFWEIWKRMPSRATKVGMDAEAAIRLAWKKAGRAASIKLDTSSPATPRD